jgi:hypothetical protein
MPTSISGIVAGVTNLVAMLRSVNNIDESKEKVHPVVFILLHP